MNAGAAAPRYLLDRPAIAAASVRGRLQWLLPAARERSRLAIDAIMGPGPGREALARAHLAHTAAREMFIRRSWMVAGLPVEGVRHLQVAGASGRGVLVSYCHFGPFPGMGVTVAEHVRNVHQVAGGWLSDPSADVPRSLRWHRWRSMFDAAGVPLVTAAGCFPVVAGLLARGAVVVMAFDWPGSAETNFLGRPVQLASGTARLAQATGALVLPAIRQFRHCRARTVFAEPLDPRHQAGWRELHDAVAAQHERWILANPAALEDPRRTGAWEATATSARWGVPADK